jgi:quercetin dioxygenase-like cupin family protein
MTTMTARDEITIGGIAVRFLLDGEQTGGTLAMFEFDVAAGTQVPAPHSHDAYDETIYGLAGVLTWTAGGETRELGPGEVLTISRGVVHGFDNPGDVDARALAVVTPGILGPDYFREIANVVERAAGGPPDLAALAEVMRRHGLTPAR